MQQRHYDDKSVSNAIDGEQGVYHNEVEVPDDVKGGMRDCGASAMFVRICLIG